MVEEDTSLWGLIKLRKSCDSFPCRFLSCSDTSQFGNKQKQLLFSGKGLNFNGCLGLPHFDVPVFFLK